MASVSPHPTGLLINRNFALLLVGQSISILGDDVFEFTLVIWLSFRVLQQVSWAPLAVSGVYTVMTLPMLLVRPLAGVFVDRWDKRWTMIRMNLLCAILIGVFWLLVGDLP